MSRLLSFVFLLCSVPLAANAFAGINNDSTKPSFSLSDRFRATCPADLSSISQFDPSLLVDNENQRDEDGSVWVAVFRSSNNLPSVLIKDDFLNAMKIATTVQSNGQVSQSTQIDDASFVSQIETSNDEKVKSGENLKEGGGVKAQTPVAVAKLSPSLDFEGKWVLKSMRCNLKKEDTDDVCDGKSEHAEAISVCIDELILNHLRTGKQFDGVIRTKATLVSGILLDDRGFQEVTQLHRDMATHTSSLENSLKKYAERAVETVSRSPGARDRALQIISYLGREEIVDIENENTDIDNNDDYDPWANAGWS
jgi:hypothetical protein